MSSLALFMLSEGLDITGKGLMALDFVWRCVRSMIALGSLNC
jgi:hypothetical protein